MHRVRVTAPSYGRWQALHAAAAPQSLLSAVRTLGHHAGPCGIAGGAYGHDDLTTTAQQDSVKPCQPLRSLPNLCGLTRAGPAFMAGSSSRSPSSPWGLAS